MHYEYSGKITFWHHFHIRGFHWKRLKNVKFFTTVSGRYIMLFTLYNTSAGGKG